jgi:hypothetical protein
MLTLVNKSNYMYLTESDITAKGVCRHKLAKSLSSQAYFVVLLILTLAYFAIICAQLIFEEYMRNSFLNSTDTNSLSYEDCFNRLQGLRTPEIIIVCVMVLD